MHDSSDIVTTPFLSPPLLPFLRTRPSSACPSALTFPSSLLPFYLSFIFLPIPSFPPFLLPTALFFLFPSQPFPLSKSLLIRLSHLSGFFCLFYLLFVPYPSRIFLYNFHSQSNANTVNSPEFLVLAFSSLSSVSNATHHNL